MSDPGHILTLDDGRVRVTFSRPAWEYVTDGRMAWRRQVDDEIEVFWVPPAVLPDAPLIERLRAAHPGARFTEGEGGAIEYAWPTVEAW